MISNKQHNSNSTLHNGSCRTQYLFNGKELDQETGYYYYGARYYDPSSTLFLGVDPLADKYPCIGEDIYRNEASLLDQGLSVLDIATLGASIFNRLTNKNTIPQKIEKSTDIIEKAISILSVYRTGKTLHNKQK